MLQIAGLVPVIYYEAEENFYHYAVNLQRAMRLDGDSRGAQKFWEPSLSCLTNNDIGVLGYPI
jgi:hypothetical protein